jgi:predicted DNA-binding transcriptional regulator YafY
MPERPTAERQLATILALIPEAARDPDGVPLGQLAERVDLTPREVLALLTEVYTRAYYTPASVHDPIQILIEEDHVSVWTTGDFKRPVRLSPRESLALGLGLRVLAAESGEEEAEALSRLAASLEGRLLDGAGTTGAANFEILPGLPPAGMVQQVIAEGARERRRCRISYLKSGAAVPTGREIDPYVLLVANGHWYAVARCGRSGEIRVFRLDRMLSADLLEGTFDVPADFDPSHFVSDGRVYRADDFQEVSVRYSPHVARWVAEHGAVEPMQDGSVQVRYSVADTTWVVRHVLEHGADAEVVAPEEVRRQVLEALRRVVG